MIGITQNKKDTKEIDFSDFVVIGIKCFASKVLSISVKKYSAFSWGSI
jgi:hypothetical protein